MTHAKIEKAMDAIGTGVLCGAIWLVMVAAVLLLAFGALRLLWALALCWAIGEC